MKVKLNQKKNGQKSQEVSLTSYFPNEIIFHIMSYLPFSDFLKFGITGKWFNALKNDKLEERIIDDSICIRIGVIPTKSDTQEREKGEVIKDNREDFNDDGSLAKKMIEPSGVTVKLIKLKTLEDIESKKIDILLFHFGHDLRLECETALNRKGLMSIKIMTLIKNNFFKTTEDIDTPASYKKSDGRVITSCMYKHFLKFTNTIHQSKICRDNNLFPHVLLVNDEDVNEEYKGLKEDFSWVERWDPEKNEKIKLTYLDRKAFQNPTKVLDENTWLKNLIENVKKERRVSKSILALRNKHINSLLGFMKKYEGDLNKNPNGNIFFKKTGPENANILALLNSASNMLKNYSVYNDALISNIKESLNNIKTAFALDEPEALMLLQKIIDEYSTIKTSMNVKEPSNNQQNISNGM